MLLVDQLMQIEQRMDAAFMHKRFDTFNLLASDRLRLLQRALQSPEKDHVFALAQRQSERWISLLESGLQQQKVSNQHQKKLAGAYGRQMAQPSTRGGLHCAF